MTKFSLSLWECYICTEEKCGLKFPHFHPRHMLNSTTPSRTEDASAHNAEMGVSNLAIWQKKIMQLRKSGYDLAIIPQIFVK